MSRPYPEITEHTVRQSDTKTAIHWLLAELGKTAVRRDLTWLGAELAKCVDRQRPFSYSYLHSILRDTLEPGAPLRTALFRMMVVVDGTPRFQVKAKTQRIYAINNLDGCIAHGERHTCEKQDCVIEFVRTHKNRKYCFACSPPRS